MCTGVSSRVASGSRRRIRVRPPRLIIKEMKFESGIDIWYARIPDRRITYVWAPAGTVHDHLSPVEIRPAAGSPHWCKSSGGNDPEFSWPAVFIKDGTSLHPAPSRDVSVSFETDSSFNGTMDIKATSTSGVQLSEKSVAFVNGIANNIVFTIQNLPHTVKWLSGVVFNWSYKLNSTSSYSRANDTQHTLFIIETNPSSANLRYQNKFLFEIIDWSCRWANNYAGQQNIFDAIWRKFHPVRGSHDTRLIYWRNWQRGIRPAQDIVTAIQSQDHPNLRQRFAASCIVFDRILINCLAVHGIHAAEIKIEPISTIFHRGGRNFSCTGWRATTTIGQGNRNAPPEWSSHWIADVHNHLGQWKIYDASYGAGNVDSQDPNIHNPVNVLNYETLTVHYFTCVDKATGNSENLKRHSNPTAQPHLIGDVLWTP